jgi:hypothetical protein
MRADRRLLSHLVLALGVGCTQSAQEPVRFELRARGGSASAELADGALLTLSRAELAFGPFYLCAGAQAGPNCETALTEWRDSRVLDLLEPSAVTLGELTGYSGRALSYMHDCGIVSLLTQDEPLLLGAAEDLDGHSAVLEGEADLTIDGAPDVPFRFELRLASSSEADRGQPVVRSSPGEFDAIIDASTTRLTTTFDVRAWLLELDQSAFWQNESCTAESSGIVCAGTVSQDCQAGESTDCSAAGQICAPNQGCQDRVVLDEDTAAGRAVAQAIVLTAGLDVLVE